MAGVGVQEGGAVPVDGYTKDGSVDLKGNPVRRSHTGRWTACFFIVVYEVFERAAFYSISTNLVMYLTHELHQPDLASANNLAKWMGTVWITPIFGAYVADAHLGRYRTFVVASALCLMGMSLLTAAVSVPSLKPPRCPEGNVKAENCAQVSKLQLAVFFSALYTVAVGIGGIKPNISTMGADQFDEFDPEEKAQKLSFFNWWMFGIFFGSLFAATAVVYIQETVLWSLGYGIPTIGLGIASLIFGAGTPFYRHKLPTGSPFMKMAKVVVAAASNWRLPLPNHPKHLHEIHSQHYTNQGTSNIHSTPSLRFLNKAAIKTGSSTDSWKLCSVTQVEETKQMLRMIPILICTFIPSTMLPQTLTLFKQQGTTLNRSVGSHFQIPPASLSAFVTISVLLSLVIYDRYFVKIMQRRTNNPRGITLLQRMGIGMILHVVVMAVASSVEIHRHGVARENRGQLPLPLPLTIFILLPQFVLMGIGDAFLEVAKIEFFYDQAPESMKSLGTSYSMTSLGIGNFLSGFLLSKVSQITNKHGGQRWIFDNLDDAFRLDYYYAFLALLCGLNFCIFLVVSKIYVYKAEVSDSMKLLTDELKQKQSNRDRAKQGRGQLPHGHMFESGQITQNLRW